VSAKLYVVAASHPCWAVARALELKQIPYRRVEWPPTMHVPMQRLRFGQGTVPGLTIDGEKLVGSRRIMARLDELRPDPPLHPGDPAARARVEEAEQWGDEVLQALARRLTWWALRRRPSAILSYSEDSRLPFPGFVTRALTPGISRIEWSINQVSDENARHDLEVLPEHLDRVDAWISEGRLGADDPNAADLQIGSSIALLRTMDDVRRLIGARPAESLASRHFDRFPGQVPEGTFPREWLPAPAPTT
jgi:glutathione S-transferase